MKKITLSLLAVSALLSSSVLRAQQSIGLMAGNHNTPYSYSLNPANTFPDKNRVYFNMWGAGLGFSNNFINYNAPFSMWKWAAGEYPSQYQAPGGKLNFGQNWLKLNGNTDNWKLYYLDEVWGPSMFFRVSNRDAIGFGLKSVAGLSVNGVNAKLGNLFRFGLDSAGNAFSGANATVIGQNYSSGAFSVNTNKWQEWFFSWARVTKDKGPHFTKWGFTGKFLLGMGAAHVGANKMDYRFLDKESVEFNNMQATYFHTSDASASATLSSPFGLKFNDVQGAGLGMDLGFTYEYRPSSLRRTYRDWWTCDDEVNNQYRWRFGASLTDFGFLAYQGNSRIVDLNNPTAVVMNKNLIDNYNSFSGEDRFEKVSNGFFDSLTDNKSDNFASTTPVALNLQYDVRLSDNFYLGANLTQSLKGAYSLGVRKSSFLSVIPRWESEHAEIGVPFTLTRDYTDLNVGLYGRLGPVIVGTDNLAGLFKYYGNNNYNAANVYFAVRFKLAACDWDYYHQHEKRDTLHKVTEYRDTVKFWQRDTIRIVKRDTIKIRTTKRDTIKVVVRDTVVKYRNTEINPDLKKREAQIAAKEAELKKKEEELRKRELGNMGTKTPCDEELAVVKRQLADERLSNGRLRTQVDDLARERDQLRRDNDMLRRDNDDLRNRDAFNKAEIDRLTREINRLRMSGNPCEKQVKSRDSLLNIEATRNAKITAELAKKTSDYDALLKTSETQKKRIAELEAELAKCKLSNTGSAECELRVKTLQAEIAAEKAKNTQLQKDLADTKTKLDAEVKKNAAIQAELDALKKSVDADKKRIAELEALVKAGSDCTVQKQKIAELEKQLADLRAEYDYQIKLTKDLQEKLKNCGSSEEAIKMKAQLDECNKKSTALEAEIAELKKTNATITAEVADLKKTNSSLSAEIATHKAKITDLEAKLKECQSKGTDCSTCPEVVALKAELDASKKKVSELEAEVAQLKKDKTTLNSDITAYKATIADLGAKLQECQGKTGSDCKACEDELAQMKLKYEQKSGAYDAVMEEYKMCSKDLADLKAKLASCESKLKDCSGSSSSEVTALKAEVDKLKRTIAELNAEVDARQKSLEELQASYDKLTVKSADQARQITALQTEISGMKTQISTLQEQLKQCQEGGIK